MARASSESRRRAGAANYILRPRRMSPVLFYDPGCPAPYSRRTLETAALGGTEATVVRIAEALDADVMQHNRTEADGRYLPASAAIGGSPDFRGDPPRRG